MIKVVEMPNFAGGVNNRDIPENIAPNELADSSNLLLSLQGFPEPRLGYAALGGTKASIKGIAVYIKNDGTNTYVVRSNDELFKFVSPSTWTSIGSLATGGDRTCFVNWDNKLYIADGYNFKYWDGTTYADVAHGLGKDFFPRYLCAHDTRLWAGNFSYDGTDYPNRISWCSSYQDTNWKTGTPGAFNYVEFDYAVTNMVSFDHLLVGTEQDWSYAYSGTTTYASDYFPSVKQLNRIGSLPFTAVRCGQDVYFTNQTGVYSIRGVQNFGDLEAARVSYRIDGTFKNDFTVSARDNCYAFYYEDRDEYWLSIPTGSTYRMLVGKVSLRDQAGRIPWMPQDFSFREWCFNPVTKNVVFGDSTNVWLYGGRSDNTTAIPFYFRTATIGAAEYNRKDFMTVDTQFLRYGPLVTTVVGTIKVFVDNSYKKTLTATVEGSGAAVSTWANFLWNDGSKWSDSSGDVGLHGHRNRVGRIGRTIYFTWDFSSAVCGVAIKGMSLRLAESNR